MPPYAAVTCSTSACADSAEETSVRTNIAVPPAASISLATRSPDSCVEVGHDHGRPLGAQRLGVRLADPLGRAGDDDDLAVESAHLLLSL